MQKRVRSVQAGVEALAAPGGLALREYASSSKPSRCLVVQSGSMDADALGRAEEDLAIMGRILDKTVKGKREDDRLFAMGINVDGSVFGSSSGARNIYVEGYGAMFLLTVKFPLLAPPEKAPEPKAKDTTSDEWKRAREEISAAGDGGGYFEYGTGAFGSPAEDFDEEKVDSLKTALIEALKNATHMRMVKPSEWITIVVQGSDVGGTTVTKSSRDGRTAARVSTTRGGGNSRRSESVMTLRVKKSDADAFAAGKLELEAFRKKVETQSYLRRPMAWTIPDAFNLPVVR